MKNFLFIVPLCFLLSPSLRTQTQIIPLDHQVQNRFGSTLYSIRNNTHTAIQPYELRDITKNNDSDSLLGGDLIIHSSDESWFFRKLLHEHLIEEKSQEFSFTGDLYTDVIIGRDFHDSRNTLVNMRGFRFAGTVSDNFALHLEFFENQAKFPKYLETIVKKDSVVPGQGFQRPFGTDMFDYAYTSAVISYRPSQYLSIQGGHGKNFVGDGYRSLLLSDVAFNYPYFKIVGDLWKIRYMTLWTEFQNIIPDYKGYTVPWNKKGGVFHFLDASITDQFSFGIFEGVIWQSEDSLHYRGIEWNYLNPIIFLRPVEFSLRSPDNVVMGINTKYIVSENNVLYGQFMIDEMTIDEFLGGNGYWGNKYGMQLGMKSFNAFQQNNLFFQGEINLVSPYTYSHKVPKKNYAHYRQSLAHPLGANFYEGVLIASYEFDRFRFRFQTNIAQFGTDSTNKVNYGQNISKSYDTRSKDYGNFIGQGLKNNLLYSDLRVSYIINPLINFRVEGSVTYRLLETEKSTSTTLWFTLGVRTSFRNIYYDF